MPHRYDAAGKDLIETFPADWLNQLGLGPVSKVEVINADLSTVTAMADKVLRVVEAQPWLAHIELQASADPSLPLRLLRYNVLLQERHQLPVHTVVVVLRPEADKDLGGHVEMTSPRNGCRLSFDYEVARVWQLPADAFLKGGLGTLPLAPLGQVKVGDLPAVIRAMDERVGKDATPALAASLWVCTFILMGLRYPRDLTKRLLQGVHGMKESVTYQAILEEGEALGELKGKVQEARHVLLLLGRQRYGAPTKKVQKTLSGIDDVARLERMLVRIHEVDGWDALLQTP